MNLLLVTIHYPHHPGEDFIDNEIGILAGEFERVYILQMAADHAQKPVRPLPSNVEVLDAGMLGGSFSPPRLRAQVSLDDMVTALRMTWHERSRRPALIRNLKSVIHARYRGGILADFIRRADIRVVYCYWSTREMLAVRYALQHLNGAVCAVSKAHGFDLYAERHGMRRCGWHPYLFGGFQRVFPCSRAGSAYLKTRYPEYAHKIECAYMGVAPQELNGTHASREGVLRIVTCSYMVPVKRLDLLARALMQVKRAVRWTHMGDGVERDRIHALAASFPGHIRFVHTGHLSNAQIMEYYRTQGADLFVNVSESEGLPVSIMEAMSFGIPVMATNVGGVSEIVTGETGMLLDARIRAEELALAIDGYTGDRFDRQTIAEWQRRHFSTANHVRFTQMLKSLAVA